MTARTPSAPPARRRFWTRYRLLAICVVGVVAVALIANTHPWNFLEPSPSFVLQSVTVTIGGSGASGVHSASVCSQQCPFSAKVGTNPTFDLLIVPDASMNCSPTVHYSITKVATSSSGAFSISGVTANSGEKLPVTLPDPLGAPVCQTRDTLHVSLSVSDQGPSTQTLALQVTVTHS
jgi:hypothetical protein